MREGWTYKKLGEVCEVLDSLRKPVTKKDRTKGVYPYYGASGIQDYVDSYIFDGRYLLVGEDGAKWGASDKSAYIIEGKSWVNNHAHILTISDDNCDTFIEYYLTFKDLSQYITGAIVPKLTQKSLVSIPIPIPPLSEQQSIVAELDKINELISLKKAQLSDLDSLAQSIFYDMFGDPIVNEKGWEVKKLGDECVDMKYGTSRPASENGRYKYLRMGNITSDGHLDLLDLKYIDIPDEEVEKCIVRHGDILFNRTNSYELIGKTCMFDMLEPMIIAGYIIRVRLSNNLHPRYVSIMFNLPSFKKLLRSKAKGAVNQANINSKELASIRISLPPLSLQQEFAKRIELIEQQKTQISSTIKDLETLLASRMQYWFD